MSIVVNFADVSDFDLIPEGKYPAIVTEVTLAESNAGDSHNLVWEWSMEVNGSQRKMKMWSSLKPTALWRLKRVLKAVDSYQDELRLEVDEDTGFVLSPELVGRTAILQIKHAKYEGEMRANIGEVFPPGDGGPEMTGTADSGTPKKSKARLV